MKGRHQGRAFSAGGHITAAEVGNGCYTGDFSDSVCITDLQRKAVLLAGPMTHGLPVVADGGWLQIMLCDEGVDDYAGKLAEPSIGMTELIYVVVFGLAKSKKLCSEILWYRVGLCGSEGNPAVIAYVQGRDIQPIDAGPADAADERLRGCIVHRANATEI